MTQERKDQLPVQRLLVPKYILLTSRILKRISPWLASRFAARLFLIPFRYKLPERERVMDQHSRQSLHEVPGIGRKIRVYRFGETSRKILLVHGWSGRGTQLARIAEHLLRSGYSCVSFDAPAHGKATGKTSIMTDFIAGIHYLAETFGPFEAAIGHSLGGMSLLRAAREGFTPKKLVIIAAANSITHITREFNRNLKLNDAIAARMKAYLDQKLGEDMDHYSGAVSAKEVHLPTLVIHDQQDVDVHISSAYEIDRALSHSQLLVTQGLGHRRILGNKAVINKITTFLQEESLYL